MATYKISIKQDYILDAIDACADLLNSDIDKFINEVIDSCWNNKDNIYISHLSYNKFVDLDGTKDWWEWDVKLYDNTEPFGQKWLDNFIQTCNAIDRVDEYDKPYYEKALRKELQKFIKELQNEG